MCPSLTHGQIFCACTTTDIGACRTGGPVPGPPATAKLKREGLRAAVDLGATAGVERLDGRARQGVVRGEKPAKGFLVAETAVEKHRERPAEPLDDLVAVKEGSGDGTLAGRPGDGEQLAIAEELLDPAGGKAEPRGYRGE